MEQVNELLMQELSFLISENKIIDNGIITITFVKCSPNLRDASVGISVLPENISGTALKELRRSSSGFSKQLRKKLNLKYIPKFHWQIDTLERNAIEIDKVIKQINEST